MNPASRPRPRSTSCAPSPRSAPVRLVAHLDTERKVVVLRDRHGRKLAEVVDDEVSLVDGTRLAARFRELEVEFTEDASPSFVASVTARLRAAGAGQPDPVPKIVRALGPRAAEPPDVPPAPRLGRTSTPIDVVRAAIASGTQRLLANDPVVRQDSDPEGVHQARVATRRLRSDLRTFGALLDPDWTDALRAELGWIGGLLGAVRDADVLLERLDDRIAALPPPDVDDAKHLLDALSERRERDRAELLDAMRSPRYLALLDHLVDASREPALALDADVDDLELAGFAPTVAQAAEGGRRVGGRSERPRAASRAHPGQARAVRVGSRRAGVRQVGARVLARDGSRARRPRRAPGRGRRERVAPRHATGAGTFVAGELVAIERATARATRDEWRRVWATARRKRLRRWMQPD